MQTQERPTEVTPPRQPVPRRKMDGDRKSAVVAGVLFITAIVAGVLSKLLLDLVEQPDYLSTIAGNQARMALGALCIVVMSFAGAGIAIALYPVLRGHGEGLALGAVCFRTMEAVIFLVAGIALFSLLARYLTAGPGRSGIPWGPSAPGCSRQACGSSRARGRSRSASVLSSTTGSSSARG